MPALPRHFMMQLAPKAAELTGPKGPKLPGLEETAAIEGRMRAVAERLRFSFPFFLAVAVPCE